MYRLPVLEQHQPLGISVPANTSWEKGLVPKKSNEQRVGTSILNTNSLCGSSGNENARHEWCPRDRDLTGITRTLWLDLIEAYCCTFDRCSTASARDSSDNARPQTVSQWWFRVSTHISRDSESLVVYISIKLAFLSAHLSGKSLMNRCLINMIYTAKMKK